MFGGCGLLTILLGIFALSLCLASNSVHKRRNATKSGLPKAINGIERQKTGKNYQQMRDEMRRRKQVSPESADEKKDNLAHKYAGLMDYYKELELDRKRESKIDNKKEHLLKEHNEQTGDQNGSTMQLCQIPSKRSSANPKLDEFKQMAIDAAISLACHDQGDLSKMVAFNLAAKYRPLQMLLATQLQNEMAEIDKKGQEIAGMNWKRNFKVEEEWREMSAILAFEAHEARDHLLYHWTKPLQHSIQV